MSERELRHGETSEGEYAGINFFRSKFSALSEMIKGNKKSAFSAPLAKKIEIFLSIDFNKQADSKQLSQLPKGVTLMQAFLNLPREVNDELLARGIAEPIDFDLPHNQEAAASFSNELSNIDYKRAISTQTSRLLVNDSRSPAFREKGEQTWFNKEAAEKLGLKEFKLRAYPGAELLIDYVVKGQVMLGIDASRRVFCREWGEQFNKPGGLPPPFIPPKDLWDEVMGRVRPGQAFPSGEKSAGNFSFLHYFANGQIVENLTGENKPISCDLGQASIILAESWDLEKTGKRDSLNDEAKKLKNTHPPLRAALGIDDKKVGVTFPEIKELDKILWLGDPSERRPTPKHIAALQSLGLSEREYEIRRPTAFEWLRLAGSNNWDSKRYLTTLDGYFDDNKYKPNIVGNGNHAGGASSIVLGSRDGVYSDVVHRLVIAKKKRSFGGQMDLSQIF